MKNSWVKRLMFVVPMLLVSATAFSFSQFFSGDDTRKPTAPREINKPVSTKPSIISSQEGVSIVVTEGILGDVLQEVANETDIRFQVSNKLVGNRITADVRAPDWATGVQELLKGNSTISLWDADSNVTDVVVMQSHKRQEQSSAKPNISNPRKKQNDKTSKASNRKSANSGKKKST